MKTNLTTVLFRRILPVIVAGLFILGLLPSSAAFAAKARTKTLRVGFPLQSGLTEVDEQGNMTGYTYEYFKEISQYTGWEYEFVRIPGSTNEVLSEMLDMLRDGELDLLGGMTYNEQLSQIYEYPATNYGSAYSILCVLEDNLTVNETNYQSMPKLRVAVLKTAKNRNAELEDFCTTYNINLEMVTCENEEEQFTALQEGQADALLSVDLSAPKGIRTIAKFSPRPYYIATTKGNTDIASQLNGAIMKINETDPYFSDRLYEKYFSSQSKGLFLTEEEKAYLNDLRPLRVAVNPNDAPLQYYDSKNNRLAGIDVDYLEYVSKQTGLRFEYVKADSKQKMQELLLSNEVDLICGLNYDYVEAEEYGVILTRAYLTIPVIMIVNNRVDAAELEGKTLALPEDYTFLNNSHKPVVWYQSTKECLDAIEHNKADYGYSNGYSVQYYSNQNIYSNLSLIPQSELTQRVCIGVSKKEDTRLTAILNKVSGAVSNSTLQTIIYQNTVHTQTEISLSAFVDSNPRVVVFAVTVSACVIILFLCGMLYLRIRSGRRAALDNERFYLLSDLSNEYLFEYDYALDCLTLSGKNLQNSQKQRQYKNFIKSLIKNEENIEEHAFLEWLLEHKEGTRNFQMKQPDGVVHWIRMTNKNIRKKDGRVLLSVGKFVDIQEEIEEKQRLQEEAQLDSLTKVYNAATSRLMITNKLKQTQGDPCGALFIIDIDRFKTVNDRYGHYTGDQILIKTAELLKSNFRQDDVVGRLGGDEFFVYAPGPVNLEFVEDKCSRILAGAHAIIINKAEITLSIGVALANEGQSYDVLYKKADNALYAVKNNCRNGFEIA